MYHLALRTGGLLESRKEPSGNVNWTRVNNDEINTNLGR